MPILKLGNENLTNQEKAKIRMNKLIVAEKDGRLARAMNREDIFRIAEINNLKKTSQHAWLARLIRRGVVTETISEKDPKTGRVFFEYHIFPNKLGRTLKKNYRPLKTMEFTKETKPMTKEKPTIAIDKPAETPIKAPSIEIPLPKSELKDFSLTLNINFIFKD